ncbi:MAG: haloacid dehalogenase type II [Hyphomicrobiales bacterium]|nr:haloacid dehalogenase type II [Hyphomicrobiales bacterium]
MTAFPSVKAVVFDAYGTLFDVHSPTAKLLGEIGPKAARLSELWRLKQLEYTWLRSLMGVHADFWQVTQDGLDYALETTGITDESLRSRLLSLYRSLDAYPDALSAVSALRAAGLRTAILSNGAPEMLEQAVTSALMNGVFDAVLSIEMAGVYKPSPRVYALATEVLQVEAADIAFVSSNGWDVAGAAQFGFHAVHVNRARLPPERMPAAPRAIIESLAELPALLGV